MPLAAPLANLSVYYATRLPGLAAEWTDAAAAQRLPERIGKQHKTFFFKKSSKASVEQTQKITPSAIFLFFSSKTIRNPIKYGRACSRVPVHEPPAPIQKQRNKHFHPHFSLLNTF